MKIRNGFVSNSSSSSYIIDRIPAEFVVDSDVFIKHPGIQRSFEYEYGGEEDIDNILDTSGKILKAELVDTINNDIERLRQGHVLVKQSLFGNSVTDYFNTLVEILEANDFVLDVLDSPNGDGGDEIRMIKRKRK